MKIQIIKDKFYGDHYLGICPKCNAECDTEDEDYVEKHPMIWCLSCGSRFVIDYPLNKFNDFLDNQKQNNIESFSLDLLMIKRIANSDAVRSLIGDDDNNFFVLYRNATFSDEFSDEFMKNALDNVGIELNSYNMKDIFNIYEEYNLWPDAVPFFVEVLENDGSCTHMGFCKLEYC